MALKNVLKYLKSSLLEGLFPKGITCNICGRELFPPDKKYSLCFDCSLDFVSASGSPIDIEGETVYSRFEYGGVPQKYVLQYKDSGKLYLTEYIARYLYEYFITLDIEADEVTFVPTSKSALRRRGYDGMKSVARYFSEFSGIPLNASLARNDGRDQTEVEAEQREANVKDMFFSTGSFTGTVLLLDDVVTTGATLRSCAEAIRKNGGRPVCLTFARAGTSR